MENRIVLAGLVAGVFLLLALARAYRETEKRLMLGIARQDQTAMSDLYDRYATILYSLILAIVRRQETAENILQDVFMQVWRKASLFDVERGSVYVWLTAMARNRAIDHIRSRSSRNQEKEISESLAETLQTDDDENALEALVTAERARQTRQALDRIPEEQRQLIQMAYYEGYTQSQLAERLDLPLGTVKTRMRQGMKKLRDLLIEQAE